MSNTMRCILIVCVAFALLATSCSVEASNSRPPRNNEINTMADAYKFLQDLDTYYGDRARVRFGKRNPMAQLFRNRMLDASNVNGANGELMVHAIGEEEGGF
ncbi:uncharacterized protein Dwil_GK22327 [Drosophila willistoni]|uniref:Neuropeptide F n=1 Tax=Drosophila willistoni TaxID=7260 RepID=B4NF44_DROWI|nr:neuropeptide F [Drosophila willistoni]XP_023035524.1 neuropeptide F [Drosophila willistoni]AGF33424.1 neuropeptide F [Drosophila willistoni]EDW83419.1 uncharacterized protein Dwil_GK22327 [Drosophila willistoni]